jgi:hypothetical protein
MKEARSARQPGLGPLVLVAVAFLASADVARPQLSNLGPSGGGWLHSAAFGQSDDDVIAIGADNAGVYRSTDFGDSWTVWNAGLASTDDVVSFYVEDLVGIDQTNFSGFIAATRGGIYAREHSDTAWTYQTPPDNGYKYAYKMGSGPDERPRPIPFSCLDYDGVAIVVAGAGRHRWEPDPPYKEETTFYPGLARADFDTSFTSGPSLPDSGRQWAVWSMNVNSGSAWYPDTSGNFPQEAAARDISITKIGSDRYLVVATADSIMWKMNSAGDWAKLPGPDLDPTGSTVYGDSTCWSIHVTQQRAVFGAFDNPDGGISGVYVYPDVEDSTASWIHVGGGSSATLDPNGMTISQLGEERAQLVYMTVAEDTNKDRIWVGAFNVLDSGKVADLGLYRTTVWHADDPDSAVWEHVVYEDPNDTWYPSSPAFDPGLITGYDANLLFPPAVAPSNPAHMVMQLNSRLHVTDDGGTSWDNVYCDQGISGGWKTRGYSQGPFTGLGFEDDGDVVAGAADHGLYRSTNSGRDEFVFTRPPVNKNGDSLSVYTVGFPYVHPAIDDRASGDQILFGASSGEGANAPGSIVWIDSTNTWHNLTYDWEAQSDRYVYFDFLVEDVSSLWVPYVKYDMTVGSGNQSVVASGVLHGEATWSGSPPSTDPGTWSWAPVDSGLTGMAWNVMFHEPSNKILAIARYRSGLGNGGLFYQDSTEVWRKLLPDSSGTWNPLWVMLDFHSIAQSSDGMVLYVATGGTQSGFPRVAKCDFNLAANDPNADPASWEWEVISDAMSFKFGIPLYMDLESRDSTHAGNNLPNINALAVDPSDPDVVYAGIENNSGSYPTEGVWEYDPVGEEWSQLGTSEAHRGLNVKTMEISSDDILYVGTGGLGILTMDLGSSPRMLGPRGGSPFAPLTPLEFVSVTPTPSAGPIQFTFRSSRGQVELDLYNVAGRRVRSLGTLVETAAVQRVLWDGRDSNGKQVASGIYFGKLKNRNESVTTRVVMLR